MKKVAIWLLGTKADGDTSSSPYGISKVLYKIIFILEKFIVFFFCLFEGDG